MDIRINRMTSTIHLADESSPIAPEVLDQIVREVLRRLDEDKHRQMERERDEAIETRAANLDRGL